MSFLRRLFVLNGFILIVGLPLFGQIPAGANAIFFESFDSVQTAWNMSTTTSPINNTDTFYRETVVTMNNSAGAATDTVDVLTTAHLTSPLINVSSYANVFLSFDQICYVDRLNLARIEYKFANSSTWAKLPDSTYSGTSFYSIPLFTPETFNKRSNPVLWHFTSSTHVFAANTNAWVHEVFDLTGLIASHPASDSLVQFRFAHENSTQSLPGRVGTHRWFIDNFLVYEDNAVGIEKTKVRAKLNVFPNPANNTLNLSNESTENARVQLVDLTGKKIQSLNLLPRGKIQLDVSQLPNGLYLIESNTRFGSTTQKVIIQ